jgi:hypothetical protein
MANGRNEISTQSVGHLPLDVDAYGAARWVVSMYRLNSAANRHQTNELLDLAMILNFRSSYEMLSDIRFSLFLVRIIHWTIVCYNLMTSTQSSII